MSITVRKFRQTLSRAEFERAYAGIYPERRDLFLLYYDHYYMDVGECCPFPDAVIAAIHAAEYNKQIRLLQEALDA